MSEYNGVTGSAVLDQATQLLRDSQSVEIPPGLMASTMDAIRGQPMLVTRGQPQGSRVGKRLLWLGSAAASLLLALTAAMMLISQGGARVAFAQVLNKVKASDCVEFVIGPGLGDIAGKQHKAVFHSDKLRVQHADGIVMIVDLATKKGLYLDDTSKTACRFMLPEQIAMEFAVDPITQLRNVKADGAERLSNEMVDGKDAEVFRVRGISLFGMASDKGEVRVWVDATTMLPVKVELRIGESPIVTLKEIKWGPKIEPATFALEIPKGFSEQPEDDFRKRLQPAADASQGLTPAEAFRKYREEN